MASSTEKKHLKADFLTKYITNGASKLRRPKNPIYWVPENVYRKDEVWDSHNVVDEDSSFVRYHAVSVDQ